MLKWKRASHNGDRGTLCLFYKPTGKYGVGSYVCQDDLYVPISKLLNLFNGIENEETSISLENCF